MGLKNAGRTGEPTGLVAAIASLVACGNKAALGLAVLAGSRAVVEEESVSAGVVIAEDVAEARVKEAVELRQGGSGGHHYYQGHRCRQHRQPFQGVLLEGL